MTVPAIISFTDKSIVYGFSIQKPCCIQEEVNELWLNGNIDSDCLAKLDGFTSLKKVKLFTYDGKFETTDERVEVVHENLFVKPSTPTWFVPQVSAVDVGYWESYDSFLLSGVSLNDQTILVDGANVHESTLKSSEVKYTNCVFGEKVVFEFAKVSFVGCRGTFHASKDKPWCREVMFSEMTAEDIAPFIQHRFRTCKKVIINGVSSVPDAEFTGSMAITTNHTVFNTNTTRINDMRHFYLSVPFFMEMLFPFRADVNKITLTERDPQMPAATIARMTKRQLYDYYTGQIPFPVRAVAQTMNATLFGRQTVHMRGFENACIDQYKILMSKCPPSFAAFSYLSSCEFPHELIQILVGYNFVNYVSAVVYRGSLLENDHHTTWLQRLAEEVKEGNELCLLGLKNRLINSLVGLADEVQVPISLQEDLQNQFTIHQQKKTPASDLKQILLERGHSELTVDEWMQSYS